MTSPGWRRLGGNALLACVATLVALLGLEGAFRLGAFAFGQPGFEEALAHVPKLRPGQEAGLGEIIRRSRNRKVVYELAPHLDVSFMEAKLTTDSHGFRGTERPIERTDGKLRVVGIGDSVMFGWGVDDDQSYVAQLEQLLNDGTEGSSWEVFNLAVPGYNGVMEVEFLKEKGLQLEPDIVVLGFCGNDLKLPGFLWRNRDLLSLRQSYLLEFVRQRLGRAADGDFDIGLEPPGNRKGDTRLAWQGKELPNLPPGYADLVGKQSYRRAMEELAALSQQHGFDVLVVAVPSIPRKALGLFEGLGFCLVDTQPVIDGYIHRHAISDWRGSPLAVSPHDPHPSPLANSLIAGCLRDHINGHHLPRGGVGSGTSHR